MVQDGPRWWHTEVVRSTGLSHERDYYILFEFFEKNAQKYAILRTALSDGDSAWEGTFSHDEIFAKHGLLRGSETLSEKMRKQIEGDGPGRLFVKEDETCLGHPAIEIRVDEASSLSIQLEQKLKIDCGLFVERVISYLTHVETQLRSQEAGLKSDCAKRDALQTEVELITEEKETTDESVQAGVMQLMLGKAKHWQ